MHHDTPEYLQRIKNINLPIEQIGLHNFVEVLNAHKETIRLLKFRVEHTLVNVLQFEFPDLDVSKIPNDLWNYIQLDSGLENDNELQFIVLGHGNYKFKRYSKKDFGVFLKNL